MDLDNIDLGFINADAGRLDDGLRQSQFYVNYIKSKYGARTRARCSKPAKSGLDTAHRVVDARLVAWGKPAFEKGYRLSR